jgi:hypothetical protein
VWLNGRSTLRTNKYQDPTAQNLVAMKTWRPGLVHPWRRPFTRFPSMRCSNDVDYWQPNLTQFDHICAEIFVMSNVTSYFEASFQSFRWSLSWLYIYGLRRRVVFKVDSKDWEKRIASLLRSKWVVAYLPVVVPTDPNLVYLVPFQCFWLAIIQVSQLHNRTTFSPWLFWPWRWKQDVLQSTGSQPQDYTML